MGDTPSLTTWVVSGYFVDNYMREVSIPLTPNSCDLLHKF